MFEEPLYKLQNLRIFQADCNGYNALAPNLSAVLHAEDRIVQLFLSVAEADLTWSRLNVVADADSNFVFKLWSGK